MNSRAAEAGQSTRLFDQRLGASAGSGGSGAHAVDERLQQRRFDRQRVPLADLEAEPLAQLLLDRGDLFARRDP